MMNELELTPEQRNALLSNGINLGDFAWKVREYPEFINEIAVIHSIEDLIKLKYGDFDNSNCVRAMVSYNNEIEDILEDASVETIEWEISLSNFPAFCKLVVDMAVQEWLSLYTPELKIIESILKGTPVANSVTFQTLGEKQATLQHAIDNELAIKTKSNEYLLKGIVGPNGSDDLLHIVKSYDELGFTYVGVFLEGAETPPEEERYETTFSLSNWQVYPTDVKV